MTGTPGAPLSPYTVLDLTRARSGPTCVRHLADLGANVIQVAAREEETGDFSRRGFDAQNLHRNKRSMTLDLKAPEGLEILERLVAKADILVENFRPDVKNRLGVKDVFENEQIRHLGMAVPTKHPALGELRLQRPPSTLSRTPASIRTHSPDVGEHTDKILGEIGYSKDDVARLRRDQVVRAGRRGDGAGQ